MWWSVLSKRQFGQACLQACFAPKQRLSILLTFRNFHLLGCHIPCLSCNTCQSLGKQLHLPPARKCSIQHWLLPWTLSQTGGLDWVIYVIRAYENSEASSKIPLIPLIWDVAPAGSCRLSLPVPWQNHPIFSYQGSVQNSPFWQKWMVDARSGQSILNSWFQGINYSNYVSIRLIVLSRVKDPALWGLKTCWIGSTCHVFCLADVSLIAKSAGGLTDFISSRESAVWLWSQDAS